MNWRKRKRGAKIAKKHNCTHLYQWKRKLKLRVKLRSSWDKLFKTKTALEKETTWNTIMMTVNRPQYMIFTKKAQDEFFEKNNIDVDIANQFRRDFLATFCKAIKIPVKFLLYSDEEDRLDANGCK